MGKKVHGKKHNRNSEHELVEENAGLYLPAVNINSSARGIWTYGSTEHSVLVKAGGHTTKGAIPAGTGVLTTMMSKNLGGLLSPQRIRHNAKVELEREMLESTMGDAPERRKSVIIDSDWCEVQQLEAMKHKCGEAVHSGSRSHRAQNAGDWEEDTLCFAFVKEQMTKKRLVEEKKAAIERRIAKAAALKKAKEDAIVAAQLAAEEAAAIEKAIADAHAATLAETASNKKYMEDKAAADLAAKLKAAADKKYQEENEVRFAEEAEDKRAAAKKERADALQARMDEIAAEKVRKLAEEEAATAKKKKKKKGKGKAAPAKKKSMKH